MTFLSNGYGNFYLMCYNMCQVKDNLQLSGVKGFRREDDPTKPKYVQLQMHQDFI